MLKVSVIVTVYNAEKYLRECLDSIVKQTLRDWECIIVNDGSPDNCVQICEEYVQKDKRFILINQENQGVSIARNNGLEYASGKYVLFMDGDDTADADFLECLCNEAEKSGADLTFTAMYKDNDIFTLPAFMTFGALIRKQLLDKYQDVRFPSRIQPCEDGLFSHRLLALTENRSIAPLAKYNWRRHAEQTSTVVFSKLEQQLRQIWKWLEILNEFYDKYHLWNSKKLHLAKFIEHEPFELRLLDMQFSKSQQEELFLLIKNYVLSLHLNKEDYNRLKLGFRLMLSSASYQNYCRKTKFIRFLSRFIPVRKYRKYIKENVRRR